MKGAMKFNSKWGGPKAGTKGKKGMKGMKKGGKRK